MTKAKQSERNEFIAKLRETLKPGDTIHTVIRSVSRSGMSRVIDFYRFTPDSTLNGGVRKEWLSCWIAKACGYPLSDRPEGVKVSGCGMDMGFSVVYDLGRILWPDGVPCIGEKCRSNDHTNGDRNRKISPDHKHRDSGYALNQEWL